MKNSKKVLTAMFALMIMAFMAGCSNGNSSSYEPNEPKNSGDANYDYESEPTLQSTQYPSDVYFTFENISDRTALTNVHEIDFRELYVRVMSEDSDYDISIWEESLAWLDERRGLLISTNTPVRYFEIFAITPIFDEHTEQYSLNATPIFYRHDEFLPEQPLFMNMFFISGALRSRGISFTDPSGARFSFALVDDRKDGGSTPFYLQEFRDGEIINGDTTTNFDPMNQNLIYRTFDGDSVFIHLEDGGGTFTIVDRMDLVWAFMGHMPFEDMKIFNDSNISDSEFFARFGDEHFFGGFFSGIDVPVSALVDVGVLTSDEFHHIARLQIQGNLYAAFNNRHEGFQFDAPVVD